MLPTYVATEFAISFSQKQFIIFQPLEIFSFSIWRESANPRFKPRVDFTVTPLQLPPLLAEVLAQLTWRMVRDLLCHKGDVAFTDPGDWSFRDWLLWDRGEDSITHTACKHCKLPREAVSIFKGF